MYAFSYPKIIIHKFLTFLLRLSTYEKNEHACSDPKITQIYPSYPNFLFKLYIISNRHISSPYVSFSCLLQLSSMSTTPYQYISWTSALVEKLLVCMITTGCHLNNRKWKECADSFYSSPQYLSDIYHKDEEKGLRRLKEKFNAEYKRVCGTLGWRDYNLGNLSVPK